MKIRNTDRFVKRAEDHKDADRFIAGLYLVEDGSEKGFEGCLIGCMAIPSKPKLALNKIAALTDISPKKVSFRDADEIEDDALVREIERSFGICEGLQRVGERFLMKLPAASDARLGGFVLAFARALPEGVEVTNERVEEWVNSRPGLSATDYNPGFSVSISKSLGAAGTTTERQAFLAWMRRGCPAPRKAVAA